MVVRERPPSPMSHTHTLAPLIESAREHSASDLFLSEGAIPRIKINGLLHEIGDAPLEREAVAEFWKLCHADPDTQRDVDTAYVTPDGVRFRVNLHRHTGKIGAVLRQIKTRIPDMEELGLPAALLISWIESPSGFVLVTGPTGCGKSTTLASCLEYLNQNFAKHVVTIEDPIEYLFEEKRSLFTQREVLTDTESFARGLRSSVRQAPDVIMLGEIRDGESAKIALQAAETGHLVLSTVHSSGVVDTLDRLLNLFPSEERVSLLNLLSHQLIGILSQMLLPTADGSRLHAVVEHLQNEGATRVWIQEERLTEIQDFLRRSDNPNNLSFMRSLVAAARDGEVAAAVARNAASNETEFDRALRGIS